EMEPALLGLTPERALSALVRIGNQSYHKGVGLFTAAISGVDSALWDVMARAAGLSLSAMLGGRARETVTPYASTGYVRPNNSVQEFRDLLEEASHGFSGAKIKIGMGLASDLERVNAARDVLGPDRHLMLDVNGNYTADEARVLCRELEGLDVAWLEEPLPPEDRDGLARLRDFTVRLATGESLFTRFAFRDHLTQRLVDVIQPDVAKVGGVSEMRALIDMARAWNLRVSPHIWGGGVALATSLQLLAHMPDYPHATHVTSIPWLEYDRGENHLRSRLLRQPLDVRNGEVAVPDGPGIGVDLDEDFVAHARIDT
ncbi:MAG: mandelate racemase/muconate lactonizing enzyme family protein, partial [Micromonosporaceae bacterium]